MYVNGSACTWNEASDLNRSTLRCMIKSIGEERLIGDIMQPYNQDNRELAAGELKRLLSYNNEQIAKTLGISRTTLWRMMGNSKK